MRRVRAHTGMSPFWRGMAAVDGNGRFNLAVCFLFARSISALWTSKTRSCRSLTAYLLTSARALPGLAVDRPLRVKTAPVSNSFTGPREQAGLPRRQGIPSIKPTRSTCSTTPARPVRQRPIIARFPLAQTKIWLPTRSGSETRPLVYMRTTEEHARTSSRQHVARRTLESRISAADRRLRVAAYPRAWSRPRTCIQAPDDAISTVERGRGRPGDGHRILRAHDAFLSGARDKIAHRTPGDGRNGGKREAVGWNDDGEPRERAGSLAGRRNVDSKMCIFAR